MDRPTNTPELHKTEESIKLLIYWISAKKYIAWGDNKAKLAGYLRFILPFTLLLIDLK